MSACLRLLATRDYEAIGMARIAKDAGCSVGALYGRFRNKNSLLFRVIAAAIHSAQKTTLDKIQHRVWLNPSTEAGVHHVVDIVVASMTEWKTAAAIRASAKFVTIMPEAARFLQDYRRTVTDAAVDRLCRGHGAPSSNAVRISLQLVFATVTDAIIHQQPGPMRAGSARMVDCLSNIVLGYLGLGDGTSWARSEADGEDPVDEESGTEDPPKLGENEVAVYDPDSGLYFGTTKINLRASSNRRKSSGSPDVKGASSGPAPQPITNPSIQKRTKTPDAAEIVKKSGRGKHQFI